MPQDETEAKIVEILKREIRLVCLEDPDDGCEYWRVKPGNIEHCAKLIAAIDRSPT